MQTINRNEFWQWAFSDFLSNSLRGVLAEFIVGKALNCVSNQRAEWDAYDFIMSNNKKIEVKSAAYLQTWRQKKLSTIRFDIAEKKSWNASDNSYADVIQRPADIYVFCIFAETDKSIADPLNLSQWFFLVLPTSKIEENLGNQKTVGLEVLEKLGAKRLSYQDIQNAIYSFN